MLTAKERWNRLDSKRRSVLERARDCSALTIPALIPPEGHTDNDPLPTPYQSLGARGVNNIASKLLLALMPPGQAFFRLRVDAKLKKQFGDKITEIEAKLAEIEQSVTNRAEASNARPVLFEVLKHLVVGGNAVLNLAKDGLRMFRLDQFVLARSPSGVPMELVIKQTVSPLSILPVVAEACAVDQNAKDTMVDVYTVVEWNGKREFSWQEINGKLVPGSESDRPLAKSEWLALRWQAVPNQDYGRGLVEEYLGDLRSLEGLSESVVLYAAVASKIVFMRKPNAVTKLEDVRDAESGDVIVGQLADIDVLQIQKYGDFQVAKSVIDDLTLRLSHAFLLRSGTIRNAERVTAEEVRAMAQELEDVLGGVYTVLASELQLPLVRRLMAQMQASNEIPTLPEGTVMPVIVTGFEALGRNHAVNKLRAWLADVAVYDPQLQSIRKEKVSLRLGTGYGVEDLAELVKTPQELAQEAQAQQQQMLAEKATAPIAGAAAKAAAGQQ